MTSRDLVRRALEFASPARVPRQMWILPAAEARYPNEVARLRAEFADDVVFAPALYTAPLAVVGGPYLRGTYIDEWGCRFENVQDGVLGVARDPLVRNWNDLERFRTPDAALTVDARAVGAFCRTAGQFVLAGTFVRPFERLAFLRSMDAALADLLRQPPELFELLGRIHSHYVREVEAWARTDVDAIVLMDDWGTNDRLMVAPGTWRRLFKPLYADYCQVARQAGKFVFMHSDGYIADILPDLIDIGVDALNCQVECMGAQTLGRAFAGKITFWGDVDQELLRGGSRDQIEGAVREARRYLSANGGVIAQCEFGPGARPENVDAVFRAWAAT